MTLHYLTSSKRPIIRDKIDGQHENKINWCSREWRMVNNKVGKQRRVDSVIKNVCREINCVPAIKFELRYKLLLTVEISGTLKKDR